MPVMNWLSNLASPDVSERNAKLFQDARRSGTDYMAALAGIKQTGAQTRGIDIANRAAQFGLDQRQLLPQIFAKNFDSATQTLNEQGFTEDAKRAGIMNPEDYMTPLKQGVAKLATGAEAAKSATVVRAFGGDVSGLVGGEKKPSGAPAAPTTGKAQTPGEFLSGLAGPKAQPKPYDPTANVEAVARNVPNLPRDRAAEVSKAVKDRGAADVNQVLTAAAQKHLGPMPTIDAFGGDLQKFKEAELAYKGRAASLPAVLQETMAGLAPAALATSSGLQAKQQSAESFQMGGKVTGWAEAGVPERSIPEGVATEAKRDLGTVRTLEKVLSNLGRGTATDDQIRAVASKLLASGKIDVNSILGVNPSLGKAVVEDGIRRGGTEWVLGVLRGNQKKAAQLVESFISSEKNRIKDQVVSNAGSVDEAKLDKYLGIEEIPTFASPSDPKFIALPKGSKFRGPNGKVRIK